MTRVMRLLAAAGAVLWLAGCAAGQGGAGGAAADPGTLAVANRLPERIDMWQRIGAAEGDGVIGVMVRYRVEGLPFWATVLVAADPTGAPVPDGPTAPLVLRLRPELAPGATLPPGVTRFSAGPPRGLAYPDQGCILRTSPSRTAGQQRDYTCGTGAGGRAVMTRITADRVTPDHRGDELAIHMMSATLLMGLARSAAGIPSAPAAQRPGS